MHGKFEGQFGLDGLDALIIYENLIVDKNVFSFITDTSLLNNGSWIDALNTGRDKELVTVWKAVCKEEGLPDFVPHDYLFNAPLPVKDTGGLTVAQEALSMKFGNLPLYHNPPFIPLNPAAQLWTKGNQQLPSLTGGLMVAKGCWELRDIFNFPYATSNGISVTEQYLMSSSRKILIGTHDILRGFKNIQVLHSISGLPCIDFVLDANGKVASINSFNLGYSKGYAKAVLEELQKAGFVQQKFIDSLNL
jgi:hypothetical protein